ncbi:MAG: ROK family protein [Propionibacteriaceae bacterium]|jgi:predicted NBD/HSP70 family sugar kinase|nr:ROK family protein [Propionibacteriaceae bacterium]
MANTTAEIRQENFFSIIRSVHAVGSASRRQLAASTGLSFATVSTLCAKLINLGLLAESAPEKAIVGRPTSPVSLNPDFGIVIGVDLAETYARVESFDASLESVSSTEAPLDTRLHDPREITEPVTAMIREEISRHRDSAILGIGISTPGVVDPVAGTSVFAPNWAWRNVSLFPLLNDSLPVPVHIDNPLKYLALAELWGNPGRLDQSFVTVNIGTGVGAGIVLDGKVLRGPTNSAGEWGHSTLVADGRACRCGSRGCVEAYVGAPGIMATMSELAPGSPLLTEGDQTATLTALGEASSVGDPAVDAILDATGRHLAAGVASLINILNPDAIVIGGWVMDHIGAPLLEQVRHHVGSYAIHAALDAMTIEPRSDRTNSVCLGAAISAFERYAGSPDALGAATAGDAASSSAGESLTGRKRPRRRRANPQS